MQRSVPLRFKVTYLRRSFVHCDIVFILDQTNTKFDSILTETGKDLTEQNETNGAFSEYTALE